MPAPPPSTAARRRFWPLVCALLALAVLVAATFAVPAVLAELRPAWQHAQDGPGAGAPGASSAEDPEGEAQDADDAAASPDPAAAGLAAASGTVDAEGVTESLDAGLAGAPGTVAAAVAVAGEDTVVAGRSQERPMVPASNQKVLTALALAAAVDPYERLETTVVRGHEPQELVLVAGGDTLLAPGEGRTDHVNGHAGLATLAERTARALREDAPDTVATTPWTVELDTDLFTGPELNPAWEREDITAGEITRVAPVALYSHRVPTADGADPGSRGDRPEDPADAVAREFARQLAQRLGTGASVTVGGTESAPDDAVELARVESATVAEQSAYMLAHSDNSLAETLARVAAVASGREGSMAGVQELIPAALAEHGIDTEGLRAVDASGMAQEDRVTAGTLARAVDTLVTDPRYGPYGRGLPVAGAEGTLTERFDDPAEAAARGVTRAKTGTLLDVVALSGYVQRTDGSVLVYSLVLNGVSGDTDRAKDTVDRTVAALAGSA